MPPRSQHGSKIFRNLLACLLLWGSALFSDVIDRIAISVGNQVITESQIDEEVRVTAFLNNVKLDVSEEPKKAAARRLVDQALIKREMDLSRYPVPALSDADAALNDSKAHFADEPAFEGALHAYGIAETQLKEHLWWQLTVLRFVDYRFRPGIQIQDSEIQAYYQQQLAKWHEQGVQPPSLSDERSQIEEDLTQQQIDDNLDRWLVQARTQVPIRYLDETMR